MDSTILYSISQPEWPKAVKYEVTTGVQRPKDRKDPSLIAKSVTQNYKNRDDIKRKGIITVYTRHTQTK